MRTFWNVNDSQRQFYYHREFSESLFWENVPNPGVLFPAAERSPVTPSYSMDNWSVWLSSTQGATATDAAQSNVRWMQKDEHKLFLRQYVVMPF